MAFDWTEFLALARDLGKRAGPPYSSEAAKRTSGSRAYYAAFCHVRNYAERRFGFQRTGTGRDHKLLREYLETHVGGDYEEIAEYLEELQKWRGQCDYDDEIDNLDVLVLNAINTAETIIQYCR